MVSFASRLLRPVVFLTGLGVEIQVFLCPVFARWFVVLEVGDVRAIGWKHSDHYPLLQGEAIGVHFVAVLINRAQSRFLVEILAWKGGVDDLAVEEQLGTATAAAPTAFFLLFSLRVHTSIIVEMPDRIKGTMEARNTAGATRNL